MKILKNINVSNSRLIYHDELNGQSKEVHRQKHGDPIDLYPYDVILVNKYQSHCIMGSNGGNRRHIVVD